MTKRVSCRFDAVVVTVVADVATVVAILDADDAFNLRETQCKNELHCFENTSQELQFEAMKKHSTWYTIGLVTVQILPGKEAQ